ncbi:MAG: hypothetical protein A2Y82_00465 [Candidatus Buchananbacteria bacterium RBG_13_36_9]|uniref:Baseplate protein J-like domain-containing protein n=1 Tax=Candidatus Buchananbacteria bacterium RBG_13_36_9 TaxID=1797530 RepID=A0A1G1XQ63_9BACT|nr:MAG: hypothetical protein A2Y82_00465 [Candidatus Buchananbacteria bacterium RBG_13_36_9]
MLHKHYVNPPLGIYKKIAFTFIILTLVLIGVIFYFTLSYAYITIYPKQEQLNTDFKFVIVENPTAVKAEEGIFQGRIINQELEGEKLFITTGQKQLQGDIVGKVKLTNELSRSQILIATTRLLTPDGILFRLKNRVEIPAKGNVEADVYADDPTKPLALAGTKFTIPGLSESLQKLVYGEAQQDLKASGQFVSAISQEELDKAVAEYSEELAQQIFKDEESSLTKILNKEIITKSFNHQVGDESLNFIFKLIIKVSGVIFDDKDVQTLALKSIEGLVPTDKQLMAASKDKLIYEIEKVDFDNKLAQLKSSVSGIAIISENSPILAKDKLVKLNLDEITAYLENFDQIENVKVAFFPSWIKKIPSFEDHIIIKIVQ